MDCQFHEKKTLEHLSVTDAYKLVGKVHLTKTHLYRTTNYINKSIQSYLARQSINMNILAQNNIGLTNFEFENCHLNQGLFYFHKLLDKQIKKESLETFSIEDIFTIIGQMFFEKRQFSQSLIYFHRLLEYQLRKKIYHHQIHVFLLKIFTVNKNLQI